MELYNSVLTDLLPVEARSARALAGGSALSSAGRRSASAGALAGGPDREDGQRPGGEAQLSRAEQLSS